MFSVSRKYTGDEIQCVWFSEVQFLVRFHARVRDDNLSIPGVMSETYALVQRNDIVPDVKFQFDTIDKIFSCVLIGWSVQKSDGIYVEARETCALRADYDRNIEYLDIQGFETSSWLSLVYVGVHAFVDSRKEREYFLSCFDRSFVNKRNISKLSDHNECAVHSWFHIRKLQIVVKRQFGWGFPSAE